MTNKQLMSDQEMFDALAEAEKLYNNYLVIQDTPIITEAFDIQENYQRDINHPLSLVLQE